MASFARGITFATNGTVTAENLHNLIDQTTPRAGIITDRSVLPTMSTGDRVLIADTDDATNAYFITTGSLVGQALSGATYGGASFTAGTIATFNSTTGTVTNLTSSTATISTLAGNTTGGTFSGNVVATAGTVTTLTASTLAGALSGGTYSGNVIATAGTITNLSTTLAGDFTISQGTATLGTTGVTAGTYGSSTVAVTLDLDAKGRITTISTSTISVTPAMLTQPLTLAASVASTSGTAIDFTGIPSWAKRITVMLDGVSTNGSSVPIIQLGDSGGIETSGYIAGASDFISYQSQTSGIPTARSWANTFISSGSVTILLAHAATNTWVASGNFNDAGGSAVFSCGGKKATSETLDRLRITTVGGTDTFDAGTINIMYEG